MYLSRRAKWVDWVPIHEEGYNHLKEGRMIKGAKFVILRKNEILFIP